MKNEELIELLEQQANEIADAGINGWGNTMLLAADRLRSQAGTVPAGRKWQIYVESTPTADDAKRELGLLVDGVSEFAGRVVMLVDENGKCPAVTGCGPEGLRNAEQIVAAMAAAPPSPAADERVRELEAALQKLINVAEQCDCWEFFPSSALDEANTALAARKADGNGGEG